MNRSIAILGIVAMPFAAATAAAQEADHHTITVTGTATVRYYADAARIHFRVRNSEPTVDEARKENEKSVKLLDEKLAGLKIKDMAIAFAPPTALPFGARAAGAGGMGGRGGGGGGFPGGGGAAAEARKVASTQLGTLVVRDADHEKLAEAIAKIEKALIDSGVAAPNVAAEGLTVSFYRREETEFREEALTKAVQNSLRKANALAKGAGARIKEAVSIVEHDTGAPDSTSTRTYLSPGELEITVRVTVKYTY